MSWRLSPAETALLVVDVQEKLVAAVQEPSDWLVRLEILVKGASLLGAGSCKARENSASGAGSGWAGVQTDCQIQFFGRGAGKSFFEEKNSGCRMRSACVHSTNCL